jgi:hypothetical protein
VLACSLFTQFDGTDVLSFVRFATSDRFVLIYCPSRSKRFCKVSKAKTFVSVSMGLVGLANAHLLVGYERIHLNETQTTMTYDCNIHKDNHIYHILFRFYDSYVESVCFVIVPFILMSLCSFLIILQIFETRKTIRYNTRGKFYYYTFSASETIRQSVRRTFEEQGRTRLRDKDIQLCSMLIGTTLAFLLLCLPTEINDLFNDTGRERSCSDWFRKVILMLFQQIYYAGHFYIYTLTGQLFRKHLFLILFGHRYQSANQEHQQTINWFSPIRVLTNLTNRYEHCSNSVLPNGQPPASCTTTSVVHTASHRPTITVCELTRIQSTDTYALNDPTQRLLSHSKSTLHTS